MNCSQLFLGIEKQLDEIRSELFSVTLIPSASAEAKDARAVLGSKYIYSLTPHTGCGCGWDFLDIGTPNDELSKKSCEALDHLLNSIERVQRSAKIYSVCIESLGTSPRSETSISAAEFMKNISHLRVPYASKGAKVYVVGA